MIKRQIFTLMAQPSVEPPSTAAGMAFVVRLRAQFDTSQFKSASSDVLKSAVRSELTQLAAVLQSPAQSPVA